MADFNYNLATANNYKIEIPTALEFNYFIQSVQLPALTMGGIDMPYQNWQGATFSNRIDFDPLTFSYLVAEDYSNYMFIYDWMLRIRDFEYNIPGPNEIGLGDNTHFMDINFIILNNNKMINRCFTFHGCFPTYLGEIDFDSSVADVTPIINTATFRYQYFDLKRI